MCSLAHYFSKKTNITSESVFPKLLLQVLFFLVVVISILNATPAIARNWHNHKLLDAMFLTHPGLWTVERFNKQYGLTVFAIALNKIAKEEPLLNKPCSRVVCDCIDEAYNPIQNRPVLQAYLTAVYMIEQSPNSPQELLNEGGICLAGLTQSNSLAREIISYQDRDQSKFAQRAAILAVAIDDGSWGDPSQLAKAYILAGQYFLTDGDAETALNLATIALSNNESLDTRQLANLYNLRAEIHAALGNTQGFVEDIFSTLLYSPNQVNDVNLEAFLNYHLKELSLNEYLDLQLCLIRQTRGSSAELAYKLVKNNQSFGETKTAIVLAERSLNEIEFNSKEPSVAALHGLLLEYQKQPLAAGAYYLDAAEIAWDDEDIIATRIWFLQAFRVYRQVGDFDVSDHVPDYERAITIIKDLIIAFDSDENHDLTEWQRVKLNASIALLSSAISETDSCLAYTETVLLQDPTFLNSNEIQNYLLQLFEKKGQEGAFVRLLALFEEETLSNAVLGFQLADNLVQLEESDLALRVAEIAQRQPSSREYTPYIDALAGVVANINGMDALAAERYLSAAIASAAKDKTGDSAKWFFRASMALERNGKPEEAIEAMENAKTNNDSFWWIWWRLANLYNSVGRINSAREHARQARKLAPREQYTQIDQLLDDLQETFSP